MNLRTRILFLFFAFTVAVAFAETEPSALEAWKFKAYTQRFMLKVEAPGEAGAANLQPDPVVASVILPLKMVTPDGGAAHPEAILLVGEDGTEYPVLIRQMEGGSEIELAFRTRPGLRRFALYAGAKDGVAQPSSPTSFQPRAMQVRVKGRTAPGEFVYSEKQPLTLERFQKLNEGNEGSTLGTKTGENINDPECPFATVHGNVMGRMTGMENPQRYTALYEAFLRVPVNGTYAFAIDTLGAAHLLIDGAPVASADAPDPARAPFAINGKKELSEGVHRVTLHYAEANSDSALTNFNLGRFGIRLHWKPPFETGYLCIPPQAFPRALPAIVTRFETAQNEARPFIHLEDIGHVRAASHLGSAGRRDLVCLCARAVGAPKGSRLRISAPGVSAESDVDANSLCAWVPAGKEAKLELLGAEKTALVSRSVRFPVPPAENPTGVVDLEGKLLAKSAPEFLYENEVGQLHLETQLAPPPIIVPQERQESRCPIPPPRPMGEFTLTYGAVEDGVSENASMHVEDATPIEIPYKKKRVELIAKDLAGKLGSGKFHMVLRLSVGGIQAEEIMYRLLDAQTPVFPGAVQAEAGSLSILIPPATTPEHLMLFLPREDDAEIRKLSLLKSFESTIGLGGAALFLGDPLVEGVKPVPNKGEVFGLGKDLQKLLPGYTWEGVCVPGPHRNLPIFRMFADLESYAKAHNGKIPGLVVLSLGQGDVARQTPLHVFERALDALLFRLQAAGAKKIVVAGVIPEPARQTHCEPYQERVLDVLHRRHISSVDIFHTWIRESDWIRRYSIDGSEGRPVFGPVPNAESLQEISKMIKDSI